MPIDNSTRFPKPLAADLRELSEGMAIVIDGDTAPKAIASGQYLFIKNHSTLATGGYHATAAIAKDADITSSNVTPDADGIVNGAVSALSEHITTLQKNETHSMTITDVHSGVSVIASSYTRYGKLLLLYIQFHVATTLANGNILFKVPFSFTGTGFATALGLNQKAMGLILTTSGACTCIGSPAQEQYYTVVISGIEAD